MVYFLFGETIQEYTSTNMPWVIEFVSYAKDSLVEGSYEGLMFFTFATTSPLFPLPSEAYIAYSFFLGNEPALIILVAALGLTIGTFFHFMLGYIFGPKLVHFLLNKEIGVGGDNPLLLAFILIASAIPFFPDAFVMIYGAYRTNPKKFLVISLIGHIIRVFIVVYTITTSSYLMGFDLTPEGVNSTISTLNL